jgi:hypothetical protein
MARAGHSSKGKSTRKFASSGALDKTIKERRARQQKKSQIENRQALKGLGRGGKPSKGVTYGSSTSKGGRDATNGDDEDVVDNVLPQGDSDDEGDL